jgi:hypothetical protein
MAFAFEQATDLENPSFGIDLATAVSHTVADLLFVHIQPM